MALIFVFVIYIMAGIVVCSIFNYQFKEEVENAFQPMEDCEICESAIALLGVVTWPIIAAIILIFILRHLLVFLVRLSVALFRRAVNSDR